MAATSPIQDEVQMAAEAPEAASNPRKPAQQLDFEQSDTLTQEVAGGECCSGEWSWVFKIGMILFFTLVVTGICTRVLGVDYISVNAHGPFNDFWLLYFTTAAILLTWQVLPRAPDRQDPHEELCDVSDGDATAEKIYEFVGDYAVDAMTAELIQQGKEPTAELLAEKGVFFVTSDTWDPLEYCASRSLGRFYATLYDVRGNTIYNFLFTAMMLLDCFLAQSKIVNIGRKKCADQNIDRFSCLFRAIDQRGVDWKTVCSAILAVVIVADAVIALTPYCYRLVKKMEGPLYTPKRGKAISTVFYLFFALCNLVDEICALADSIGADSFRFGALIPSIMLCILFRTPACQRALGMVATAASHAFNMTVYFIAFILCMSAFAHVWYQDLVLETNDNNVYQKDEPSGKYKMLFDESSKYHEYKNHGTAYEGHRDMEISDFFLSFLCIINNMLVGEGLWAKMYQSANMHPVTLTYLCVIVFLGTIYITALFLGALAYEYDKAGIKQEKWTVLQDRISYMCAFTLLDTNKSGTITDDELDMILDSFGGTTGKPKLLEILDKSSDDGVYTKWETIKMCHLLSQHPDFSVQRETNPGLCTKANVRAYNVLSGTIVSYVFVFLCLIQIYLAGLQGWEASNTKVENDDSDGDRSKMSSIAQPTGEAQIRWTNGLALGILTIHVLHIVLKMATIGIFRYMSPTKYETNKTFEQTCNRLDFLIVAISVVWCIYTAIFPENPVHDAYFDNWAMRFLSNPNTQAAWSLVTFRLLVLLPAAKMFTFMLAQSAAALIELFGVIIVTLFISSSGITFILIFFGDDTKLKRHRKLDDGFDLDLHNHLDLLAFMIKMFIGDDINSAVVGLIKFTDPDYILSLYVQIYVLAISVVFGPIILGTMLNTLQDMYEQWREDGVILLIGPKHKVIGKDLDMDEFGVLMWDGNDQSTTAFQSA